MSPIAPIDGALVSAPLLTQIGISTPPAMAASPDVSFGDILTSGMAGIEKKVATADDLVTRFALGGDVPVHQVTYALEEAKMAVELAMQVRGRLLDGYRELMNMQL